MKVASYHIQPDQITTVTSHMVGNFTMYGLISIATGVGVPREHAARFVDRLLQRERKAARIKHLGAGRWTNC